MVLGKETGQTRLKTLIKTRRGHSKGLKKKGTASRESRKHGFASHVDRKVKKEKGEEP